MRSSSPNSPLLVAVAIAVVAVFAGSMASEVSARTARHCLPRRGEATIAQSQSTALLRGKRVLTGCTRRTGHRRVIATTTSGETLHDIHLHGTSVVYVVLTADRYDASEALYRDDAVDGDQLTEVAEGGFFSHVAIGPHRAVAYVFDYLAMPELRLARPGSGDVLVDRGPQLRTVSFTGGRLSWRHDTIPMSTPLQLGDRCPNGNARVDTTALTVTKTATTSATACLRATGTRSTLTAGAITDLTTTGTWLAAATADGQILTLDARSGATATFPAPGVYFVAIDAAGSVGWTVPLHDDPVLRTTQIWVNDAAGPRLVDQGLIDAPIAFDGSTLIWFNHATRQTATLTP
jgi:hypothetical protein